MNVISKRLFKDAARKYPNDEQALLHMYAVLSKTNFNTPEELKRLRDPKLSTQEFQAL